jgi:hypothetical protein
MRVFSSALIGLLACGVTACTDQNRPAAITSAGTLLPMTATDNPWSYGIAIGEVSGGAWLFNEVDIKDSTFKQALTSLLRQKNLLANAGSERWLLDCTLDIEAPLTILTDQNITAKIRYVLRERASSKVVFDRLIQTDSSRPVDSPVAEFAVTLLIGNSRGNARRTQAENAAAGENLAEFLSALLVTTPTGSATSVYSPSQ